MSRRLLSEAVDLSRHVHKKTRRDFKYVMKSSSVIPSSPVTCIIWLMLSPRCNNCCVSFTSSARCRNKTPFSSVRE